MREKKIGTKAETTTGYADRKAIRNAEDRLRSGVALPGVANGNASGRPPRGARNADGSKALSLFGTIAAVLADSGKPLSLSAIVSAVGERIGKADPTYARLPARVAEFSRGTTNRARGRLSPYGVRGRPGGIVPGPNAADGAPTLVYDAKALSVPVPVAPRSPTPVAIPKAAPKAAPKAKAKAKPAEVAPAK